MTSPLSYGTPVSIVIPTLNERGRIHDCIASLLAQDYPEIDEILVVDGGSTDGTTAIATRLDPRVRVVDNPGVTAASAMNLGMATARNDLIVRIDAHSLYESDYVSASVKAFDNSGAAMVGGPMRPVGATAFGRAVAAVTTSPFGIGPGRFHYADEACDVDTVYLGTFDRRVILAAGGYDDRELQWAAEDQELNFRLRKAGHRIHLDPAIRSWYLPRSTPRALWRQYFNYGMCKASTLRKHRMLPTWRPLAPAALVVGTVVGRGVPALGYGAGAAVLARRLSAQPGVTVDRAFLALAICHWAYGLGFLAGVGRIVTGRPFDSKGRR